MAVALDKFVKQIEDSGIVAPGKLENFVPPKAHPKDAEELARQLVKADHLTPFQAQHVLQGKAKALILGNYTVLDKIGAGGMGQVFKAEHRRMHRVVAIKMLPPAMTKDAAALARFEREVTAASKLLHPNIVSAFDADEANGAHFLVMEYVEGKDLSAHVKKNGRFSVAKSVDYVRQAACGLAFAHAEGVIHRDIKPANLLLDKKGVVKILDMGLARIDATGVDVAAQAELTGTGAIMGTVDYMAPEQGVSTKDADARADIYSLGCTLHYLLIGRPVYGGESVAAKLVAHHNQPIPNLCALREDVPEQVNAVFQKMIAKKVEDRYQSMTEVVADLQACGADHDQLLTMQRSISSNLDNSALTFLKNIPAITTHKPKPTKKTSSASTGKRKLIYGAVGAGLLGVLVLAGIIVSLRTKDGTLIVEIDQPDATVQVLDEQGKVEISQQGGDGKVSISVDPGKHRLKVEKDGFAVFGENFEMKLRGKKAITAKLVPIQVAAMGGQPNKPWNTPAFQQWMKSVAALPAEKQIEAVSKKLMELNPGFDGNVGGAGYKHSGPPKIENGMVTEMGFAADNVTDISPVRALAGLKTLRCDGTSVDKTTLFSDLSPLHGMNLANLTCYSTQVFDLSPLQGMPLTELNCSHTQVASLSPLVRMNLAKLYCDSTQVSDLSPLRGMPLTKLACNGTSVSDLSPLAGTPLTYLQLGATKVSDLSPLKGVPLETLIISPASVSDLSPLRGMPLSRLICDKSEVSDLSPLQGMNLTSIAFTPKNITKGLDVIRQMQSLKTLGLRGDGDTLAPAEFWKKYDAGEFGKPITSFNDPTFQAWIKSVITLPADKQIEIVAKKLQELNLGFDGKVTGAEGRGTPKIENGVVTEFGFITDNVTDISPVQALVGLKALNCSGNYRRNGKLSDLSPLRGMKLTLLTCTATQVRDLSPLERMPLTSFFCGFTQVSDLSSLHGMSLTALECFSTEVSELSPLQGMPIKELNCGNTKISDLSPLRGMPLTGLIINDTLVSDVSPLQRMHLGMVSLTPTKIVKGLDIIRQMKSLKAIGLRGDKTKLPPAEFWKKFDAGEFGKPITPSP